VYEQRQRVPARLGTPAPSARRISRTLPSELIDLHTHVLAGLDDGARTLEESVEIARAAAHDGITALAATPHVRTDYPTSAAEMEHGVAALRAELAAQDLSVDVLPGGEIALDYLPQVSADELARFGLAGNPAYLLIEFPYFGWPLGLPDAVFRLRTEGVVAVLGHPERNPDVQEAPARLRPLVELGAITQLTASSIDGRAGRRARAAAFELLDMKLAHLVASDAHTPQVRATGFSAASRALKNDALARWLMNDVPTAIVARAPLPPRP
jgi:protein-tyrosine phosphatase